MVKLLIGEKKNSGVPQESALVPLLFLIYTNDLPDGITSQCKIFADDTSLFSKFIEIYLLKFTKYRRSRDEA